MKENKISNYVIFFSIMLLQLRIKPKQLNFIFKLKQEKKIPH